MLASQTRATHAVAPGADPSAPPVSWKDLVIPAENFLHGVALQLSAQIRGFDPEVGSYVEYALGAQGKQLRPVLVALSGGAVGSVTGDHVRAAVIVEMVHLATLVHDDVMDEAGLRRGQPTLAAHWGNEISVLVGDCLFAHALKLAAGFPTTEICRAISSATNTVVSGEILQTQRRHQLDLSRDEYFKILRMKTGELFAVSCDLGAYLSGATPRQRAALREFGMILGTAYQVYDDCLDLYGTEAAAGKSLGTDLAKGKLTLPMLLLLERADAEEHEYIRSLLLNWSPLHHRSVMKLLRHYDVLRESQEAAHGLLTTARHALESLPDGESRSSLLMLVDFLAQQTDVVGGAD